MTIGFWNSRGIGRGTFWTEIDMFCKTEKILFLGVAETKTSQCPVDKV